MRSKCKFLIVDDNKVDQIVTSQLLKRKLDISDISQVNTGKEALAWLLANPIEECLIILLDIRMPEMDGFEFLEAYNEMDQSLKNKTTIIMLSSTLDVKDIARAQNHQHVKELLSKPLPVNLLSEIISS